MRHTGDGPGDRSARRRRRARLGALAALAMLAGACSSSAPARSSGPQWRLWGGEDLARPALTVHVDALLAAGSGEPWLLGGNVRGTAAPEVRIWHSPGGAGAAAWSPGVMRGLTLDAPQNLVFSMARRHGVLVALGETPGQAHNNPRPTIWRSTDGLTWSEVPTLREDFGGPHLTDLRAVTAGPAGFAVLGNWKGDGDRPVLAVWLSPDGLHWTRQDHVPELTSQGDEELTGMDIAAGAAGLAIVGESYAPTAARADRVVGFVATSPDGRRWRRLAEDRAGLDNGGQVAVRRVVAEGDGWVALGTRSRGPHNEVVAWRGSPGGVWNLATVETTPFTQGIALANEGTRSWGAVTIDGRVRLWTSSGGRAWRRVAPPFGAGAQSVLIGAASGSLVLAAQTGARVAVWAATVPCC